MSGADGACGSFCQAVQRTRQLGLLTQQRTALSVSSASSIRARGAEVWGSDRARGGSAGRSGGGREEGGGGELGGREAGGGRAAEPDGGAAVDAPQQLQAPWPPLLPRRPRAGTQRHQGLSALSTQLCASSSSRHAP
eukprot:1090584-Rhodomonas_salina.1